MNLPPPLNQIPEAWLPWIIGGALLAYYWWSQRSAEERTVYVDKLRGYYEGLDVVKVALILGVAWFAYQHYYKSPTPNPTPSGKLASIITDPTDRKTLSVCLASLSDAITWDSQAPTPIVRDRAQLAAMIDGLARVMPKLRGNYAQSGATDAVKAYIPAELSKPGAATPEDRRAYADAIKRVSDELR